MKQTDADILRDVAGMVELRGLDGRTFPAIVGRTERLFSRNAPGPVARLARLVRWRGANLSAAGVACVLRGESLKLAGRKTG